MRPQEQGRWTERRKNWATRTKCPINSPNSKDTNMNDDQVRETKGSAKLSAIYIAGTTKQNSKANDPMVKSLYQQRLRNVPGEAPEVLLRKSRHDPKVEGSCCQLKSIEKATRKK